MFCRRHILIIAAAVFLLPAGSAAQTSGTLSYSRIAYSYDETGRLTQALYDGGTESDLAIAYTYAATGSMTKRFAGPADQVGVDEFEAADKFSLSQNFPNPFATQTQIRYTVPRESRIRIDLYNVIGQRVAVLKDGLAVAGTHAVDLSSVEARLASGVYFFRMTTPEETFTRKMIVAR